LFLEVILLADYCQAAAPNFRLVLSTGLGPCHYIVRPPPAQA
jgi:hypothetical protein